MKNKEDDIFHSASISGRYIYGYFCLMSVIKAFRAETMPKDLNNILKEFVETDRLDEWHDKAELFLPSKILGVQSGNQISASKLDIVRYYRTQPAIVRNVTEELFWLGMSNIHGKFDSDITFVHLVEIIELLRKHKISLPDIEVLKDYPVTQRNGWGDVTTFPNIPSK